MDKEPGFFGYVKQGWRVVSNKIHTTMTNFIIKIYMKSLQMKQKGLDMREEGKQRLEDIKNRKG